MLRFTVIGVMPCRWLLLFLQATTRRIISSMAARPVDAVIEEVGVEYHF
ncbi:MAG: hypothetical protein U0892_19265 [Pirellulales bacterium]